MDLSSSYLWQPSLFIEGSGTNVSGGISILRVSYPSFAKIGSPVTKVAVGYNSDPIPLKIVSVPIPLKAS